MAEQSIGPGTVLAGRFRLEDLVQETAGAKFWRATDRTLARSVAVHVVDSADPRADALLMAARTSATVTDGHFLRVLDAAQEDGVVYVVNEWGSGVSLDLMLDDGPLPPRRAAWLVKEVAEAISTAHRHGIAHGRLIPENVMVTEAGSVKLIGFVVDSVLNGKPSMRGADGAPLSDHESDVVNLAALLYATLVARWPGSTGTSLPPAPREHGRALRPRQVRAGVPRSLDAICDRVLNGEGNQNEVRIETAHEIAAALSDFIGDPTGIPVGHEPTTVLDRDEISRAFGRHAGTPPDYTQETQAHPPAETPSRKAEASPDPEATQAGTPLFFDDDSGVGWVSAAQSRGLRSDEEPGYRPPPPPPLPEPEPKPLFAPDPPGGRTTRRDFGQTPRGPRGDVGGSAGVTRSSGGTGSLPPVWGPDRDTPEQGDDSGWETRDAGKSWLRLAAIIAACVLLVIAVIVAFNLGRNVQEPEAQPPGGSGEQSPAALQPVSIAGVDDFDPDSDTQEENSDLASLAVDGDPGTAWTTLTYFDPLEQQKSGVGLLVDLGGATQVREVGLTLDGRPYGVEVLAAGQGTSSPPTDTDGLRQVASQSGVGGTVTLGLQQPVTTRYLVVWLTSLPQVGSDYKGSVAEIVVRS